MTISALSIAKLVQRNLALFGTIRHLCTYYATSSSTYSSGIATPVSAVGVNVLAILDEFNLTATSAPRGGRDDSAVEQFDKKVIIAAMDLPTVPTVGDEITDDLYRKWRVKGITVDPSGSIYELHVRPYSTSIPDGTRQFCTYINNASSYRVHVTFKAFLAGEVGSPPTWIEEGTVDVETGDFRGMVEARDLSFAPVAGHSVIDSSGVLWDVLGVSDDPTYYLHLRINVQT